MAKSSCVYDPGTLIAIVGEPQFILAHNGGPYGTVIDYYFAGNVIWLRHRRCIEIFSNEETEEVELR